MSDRFIESFRKAPCYLSGIRTLARQRPKARYCQIRTICRIAREYGFVAAVKAKASNLPCDPTLLAYSPAIAISEIHLPQQKAPPVDNCFTGSAFTMSYGLMSFAF
jgi:hypothetical protein